jgi:lysophospholipase L1-like esterase
MGNQRALARWGLVLSMLSVLAAPARAASGDAQYYVSLGTSLAVGIQPDAHGVNQRTHEGYADQLYQLLRLTRPRLQLVKLGCPGETSETLIAGGLCPYAGPAVSQLEAAAAFLEAHRGAVTLITLDIGANDLLPCADVRTGSINQPCIEGAFTSLARDLPYILATLREAAGPGVPIVALNYYNPLVAVWLLGPTGQAAAHASADLVDAFNALLAGLYAANRVLVADVARAFHADDFRLVPALDVPVNVVLVCQLTWMCAPPPQGPNIHANTSGYFVIALALLATLF